MAQHEAWGLGSYCLFSTNSNVHSAHGFEAPYVGGVVLHDLVTISRGGGTGAIDHVANYSDERVGLGNTRATVTRYSN